MSIENAIPTEIYDLIRNDYETNVQNLAQIESDLRDAIALGDLSENTTYDNLKVEKATTVLQIDRGRKFLKNCETLSPADMRAKYPLLFSKLQIEILNMDEDTSIKEEIILTSNIDVGIHNAVRVNDPIGQALLKAGETPTVVMLRKANLIIKVLKITPYKKGSLGIEI